MPCDPSTETLLSAWERDEVDSGIWWVRNQGELETVLCWIKQQKGAVTLATRAGDAPRLHTAGRRSIYAGLLNSRTEDLAAAYRQGVRFARAPSEHSQPWLAEARRLGIAADVSLVPARTIAQQLNVDGPPLLYGWPLASGRSPPAELIQKLAARDGVLLMLPAANDRVGYDDMRACLSYVRWDHCGIGGAARPEALSMALLGSGLSEGNVARMFGFNVLRVLQKTEVWSGKR